MKKKILLCLLMFGSTVLANKSECEFAIVIASYNNEKYYQENLESACFQKSTNPYHVYYINDCSTDRTQECVNAFIKEHNLEDKVTLINNPVNMGKGANFYTTIHNFIEDHKIIVDFDGDDLFPNDEVLLTLEKYYDDSDIWMTYGRRKTVPHGKVQGKPIPDTIFAQKKTRESNHMALRTFKAGLFKKINKEDLMRDGEFIKVTADYAYFLPMLEMCGPTEPSNKIHCVFVEEILYLYQTNNPLNDYRIRGEKQEEMWQYLKKQEPYQPLSSLG